MSSCGFLAEGLPVPPIVAARPELSRLHEGISQKRCKRLPRGHLWLDAISCDSRLPPGVIGRLTGVERGCAWELDPFVKGPEVVVEPNGHNDLLPITNTQRGRAGLPQQGPAFGLKSHGTTGRDQAARS